MQVVFFRTPGEQLSFVLQNLEGPAKREAKLHVQKDSNAKDIFRLLRATFNGTKSYTELQKKFYECRQKPGKSIRDFSFGKATPTATTTNIKHFTSRCGNCSVLSTPTSVMHLQNKREQNK